MLNSSSRALAALALIGSPLTAAHAQTATIAPVPSRPLALDAAGKAFGGAVDEADLGAVTGREDTGTMIASATQRNTVQNNSVTGTSTTGSVTIDGNAFQNLQGLAVISANSGNNVAMNAAMNVTVNLAPR